MDTKDGLTAWEALELLFPEPEPEPEAKSETMIKSDLELWSGGTTWVDAEYDERLGFRPNLNVPSFLDLLQEGSWYGTGFRVPVDPTLPRERIKPDLWDILGIDPDNNTASGGGLEYSGLRFYEESPRKRKPREPRIGVVYGSSR